MLKRVAIRPLNSLREEHENEPCLQRRGFLKLAALTLGGLAVSPALARAATTWERALQIYVPNTGETLRLVYWTPRQGYLHNSIQQLSWALRDYRTDETKNLDPFLLDQLYALQFMTENRQPVHVICGYRSPSTNATLCRTSRGVARNSYHLQAKALDIRMPGRSLADVRRAAMSLQGGGVGYYPWANFIHIDTGPIRYWS